MNVAACARHTQNKALRVLYSRAQERFCDDRSKVSGNEGDKQGSISLNGVEGGRDGEGKSESGSKAGDGNESKGESEMDRASDASSKQTASSAPTGSNTNKQTGW